MSNAWHSFTNCYDICKIALLIKSRLRWTGHVMRMTNDRIPKQLFLSELSTGTRAQGAPLKRYKDAVKSSLKACSIPVMGWEALTLGRTSWRMAVSQGCQMFETRRIGDLERKRQDRKERQRTTSKHVACPACGQLCASEFGLRRHQRRHWIVLSTTTAIQEEEEDICKIALRDCKHFC